MTDLELGMLPTRETSEPIIGYKSLTLTLKDAVWHYEGDHVGRFSDLRQVAKCNASKGERPHGDEMPAPVIDCTCGFYGYTDPKKAWRWEPHVMGVVEFSGVVIAHEEGFRAEVQTLTRLEIGRGCEGCKVMDDTRGAADALYADWNGKAHRLCSAHGAVACSRNAGMRVTLDELADAMGVPVTWKGAA